MIISSDDSTFINYLKSSNNVSITQDGEYVALTTNTSSNGNYCGLYWSNSSTTVYGYTLNDFLGETFKVDMEITDLSTSYWKCNVYAYIDGGFTAIASSSISDGDNSIEFTVPNDADRLWIRLQTSNRSAEYTCKTRNWRIYPL